MGVEKRRRRSGEACIDGRGCGRGRRAERSGEKWQNQLPCIFSSQHVLLPSLTLSAALARKQGGKKSQKAMRGTREGEERTLLLGRLTVRLVGRVNQDTSLLHQTHPIQQQRRVEPRNRRRDCRESAVGPVLQRARTIKARSILSLSASPRTFLLPPRTSSLSWREHNQGSVDQGKRLTAPRRTPRATALPWTARAAAP